MSNPKAIAAYPREFHSILAQLSAEGTFTPLNIPCSSHTNAQTKRNFLSGFRTALRRAAECAATPLQIDQATRRYELSKMIKTSIKVDPDTGATTLRIHPKESPSWLRGAIPHTYGTTAPAYTPTQEEADQLSDCEYLVKAQTAELIKRWASDHKVMFTPAWIAATTDRERLLAIQSIHMGTYDVSLAPLLAASPLPIEDGTGI